MPVLSDEFRSQGDLAPESRFRTDFRFWDYREADGRPRPNPEPARIYGPVFHIGPLTVCAYAVATAEGLAVIDTGYARDGDLLPENLRRLGLDPADVRLVVNTPTRSETRCAPTGIRS